MSSGLTVTQVVAAAAEAGGVTLEAVRGGAGQRGSVGRARQRAMFMLRSLRPDLSSPAVARVLNLTDHTAVLHGAARAKERAETDPAERQALDAALEQLGRPEMRPRRVNAWQIARAQQQCRSLARQVADARIELDAAETRLARLEDDLAKARAMLTRQTGWAS